MFETSATTVSAHRRRDRGREGDDDLVSGSKGDISLQLTESRFDPRHPPGSDEPSG